MVYCGLMGKMQVDASYVGIFPVNILSLLGITFVDQLDWGSLEKGDIEATFPSVLLLSLPFLYQP